MGISFFVFGYLVRRVVCCFKALNAKPIFDDRCLQWTLLGEDCVSPIWILNSTTLLNALNLWKHIGLGDQSANCDFVTFQGLLRILLHFLSKPVVTRSHTIFNFGFIVFLSLFPCNFSNCQRNLNFEYPGSSETVCLGPGIDLWVPKWLFAKAFHEFPFILLEIKLLVSNYILTFSLSTTLTGF